MSKRLKNTDSQMSNVILDFLEKKVVKCVIEGNKVESDWEKMNGYYKKIYPTLVDQLEKNNNFSKK